jgi:hypothetical protein
MKLKKFHENSWYNALLSFNFDVLYWLSLLVLFKVDRKMLVLFRLIQNFEISDLVMAKVKKVNITVTWQILFTTVHLLNLCVGPII